MIDFKNLILIISCILFFIPKNSEAQTIYTSEEKFLGHESRGYVFSGKMNEHILLLNWTNDKIMVQAYDVNLHKLWERTIALEKKFSHTILDIVCTKTDFTVIEFAERRGKQFLKTFKYDGDTKLLDSATIRVAKKKFGTPLVKLTFSDDKKTVMVSQKSGNEDFDLCVFNIASLKKIWDKNFAYKNYSYENKPEQYIVSNQGDAFLAFEENAVRNELHRYSIQYFNSSGNLTEVNIPMPGYFVFNTKFSFDNFNQKLFVAGVYSGKELSYSNGFFTFSVPVPTLNPSPIIANIFDDNFVSAFTGKKTTHSKGLSIGLHVQEILHRRDGGLVLVVEQVEGSQPVLENVGSSSNGAWDNVLKNNVYENAFIADVLPNGKMNWSSVIPKKQIPQNDESRLCSFFVTKTPTVVHLLFNDEIKNATTVSDYSFKTDGQSDHRIILNTDGKNLKLRLRDAIQTGTNELIVVSRDKLFVKLVKIVF